MFVFYSTSCQNIRVDRIISYNFYTRYSTLFCSSVFLANFSLPSHCQSLNQSRKLLFAGENETERRFNLKKTGASQERRRLHKSSESGKKSAKKLKASTPEGTFRRSNTSVRSIPNLSVPVSTIFLPFSLSLFLRPFDSTCARTTESRQQSEKQAAAKDTHDQCYAISSRSPRFR